LKQKKILLLGSKGALGRSLSAEFSGLGVPFIELSRDNFNIDEDIKKFLKLLKIEDIYIVINCIAVTGLDQCYKNRKIAMLINYFFPKNISRICSELGIKFIHFSTDNVFACDKKNYIYGVEDIPTPLTWYGITKYLGEREVIAANETIIRLPMMFGPTNNSQLVAKLIDSLLLGKRIEIANDIYTTPVYTPNIVRWVCDKVISEYTWDEKIIHLSSDNLISLCDFVSELAIGIDHKGKIVAVPSSVFPVLDFKPKYGGLKSTGDECFSYEKSLLQYLKFLKQGDCHDT
jgi:dTDP-4-dehydrorhamnose reductase